MKREDVKNKIPGITEEQLNWLMQENGSDITREKSAAAALQTPPQRCAVVEDTVTGVTAGVAAGATVFAYAPLDDGAALRAAGAVHVFRSMADLPALLGC